MKRILNKRKLLLFFQLILGFVFLFSGLKKIVNPGAFVEIVRNYKLLPDWGVNIFATVLPWMEFTLGSVMMLGLYIKQSAIAIVLLLLMFISAILINVLRGLDFSCGCFSLVPAKGSRVAALWWIFRDIVLLGFGILVYRNENKALRS
jgi:hypothetical protein